MRAIVEPISQPPGCRSCRHCFRKERGEDVCGLTCSRTSKRVIISNFWCGWDGGLGGGDEGEGEEEG